MHGTVIIYLAPTLLILSLLVAASRVRRRIEPSCPVCSHRTWNDTPVALACAGCGWTTAPKSSRDSSRLAA